MMSTPQERAQEQQRLSIRLLNLRNELENPPSPPPLVEETEFETELVRLRLKKRAKEAELAEIDAQIERLTR